LVFASKHEKLSKLLRLYNLLAEKRKELQQLQRVSEGLEHAAEAIGVVWTKPLYLERNTSRIT